MSGDGWEGRLADLLLTLRLAVLRRICLRLGHSRIRARRGPWVWADASLARFRRMDAVCERCEVVTSTKLEEERDSRVSHQLRPVERVRANGEHYLVCGDCDPNDPRPPMAHTPSVVQIYQGGPWFQGELPC